MFKTSYRFFLKGHAKVPKTNSCKISAYRNTNILDFLKLYGKTHSIASSFFSVIYFGNFFPYKQLANNQGQATILLTKKTLAFKFSGNKTRARVLLTSVRSSPIKVMPPKDDLFIAKSTEDHDPHFGLKILQAKKRFS